jgi:hypothetical protein
MRVRIEKLEGENVIVELPDKALISAPTVLFDCPREGDWHEITIDPQSQQKRLERLANNTFE